MSAAIPTVEPSTLVAGDTAKWTRTLTDYSAADSWVLSYSLVNSTSRIAFTAGASGSDHLVNVSAATTANWTPGSYRWRARVSKAGEVYTVAEGSVTVTPSFTSATEARSNARIALDNVEAYLADANNLAAASYSVAGRELQRHTFEQILKLRSQLRAEVAREEAAQRVAAGLPDPRRALVSFR